MQKINAHYLIRHLEVGLLLETFFVMAVLSLVGTRTFLYLLDYPRLATETLHIAHALWGGSFMLIGLLLAVVFLSRETRYAGAAIGGVGFGLFIDQLGKFLTHDANYFFQPAFALIYVLFLFLFYLFRAIEKAVPPTDQEYTVNALEILKDSVVHDLDVDERDKAIELLGKVSVRDKLVTDLLALLHSSKTQPSRPAGIYTRLKKSLHGFYLKLVGNAYFIYVVIGYFGIAALVSVVLSFSDGLMGGFWGWGMRLSALGSVLFSAMGIWWLWRGVLRYGYDWLRFAVLFTIFFFQFFLFYFNPIMAFAGLILNVLTLLVLEYAIAQESEVLSARRQSEPYRLFRKFVKTFVVK